MSAETPRNTHTAVVQADIASSLPATLRSRKHLLTACKC
jgi:hypothetical protein